MRLVFEIDPRKFTKLKTEMANGIFSIIDDNNEIKYTHLAKSGGWGKGPMETGIYKATNFLNQTEDAYTQFGIGWCVLLAPQFETDRTGLWIHPDGNVEGSLGCLVIPFSSIDENIKCRNLLRDIVSTQKETFLTVSQISIPQGGPV